MTGSEPRTAPAEHAPGRPRTVRADRHMSDVEALMWNVDKDPYLSSTFGSVTFLDQLPDLDLLRRRMLVAAERIPRLHQRVVPVLGRLAPPEWQDDPDFDIDFHVRHLAVPAPGDDRAVLDLATRLVLAPFDRTRPLWEFVIVEGLPDGRAAMVQKMHHTITDGEGGVRMSEQFIDVVRQGPEVPAIRLTTEESRPTTNLVDAAADAVGHTWRRTVGVAQRAAGTASGALLHPSRLPALGTDALEVARSAVRQVTVTDRAHSPLWTRRSLQRRLEILQVDFDDAYRSAKALGGSLNDWFVAGAAGGAGAYHRQLGHPVDELRMAMPVSTRSDRSAGGNAFVPTRLLVPAGIEDPVERFARVHEALGRAKGERVIDAVDTLAGFVNLLPTSVVARAARAQVETVDFTTSNVRAAPFELFIAGGRIEATYPLGPLGGTAWNLTVMSYDGSLDMGLHVDAGAVAEPDRLRRCLAEAFAEQIAAGT